MTRLREEKTMTTETSERCTKCGARSGIGELCAPCAVKKERSRIVDKLRRNSYLAGDGARVKVVKLDALLRLIGVSEDDVRSAVAARREGRKIWKA